MLNLFTHYFFTLIVAMILPQLPLSAQAASPQCHNLFQTDKSISIRVDGISAEVDGVEVTGDNFVNIRKNLNLTSEFLHTLKENRARVLSLGEGFSELLPALLQRGINAYGLDRWYHSQFSKNDDSRVLNQMSQFQDHFSAHLIRGSAIDIPFKSETLDLVLCHRLLFSLSFNDAAKAITESLRVLKISGEARFVTQSSRLKLSSQSGQTSEFSMLLLAFVKSIYKEKVYAYLDGDLLVITKNQSTTTLDQQAISFDFSSLPHFAAKDMREKNDVSLAKSYELTLQASQKRPDDPFLQSDLYRLRREVEQVRRIELVRKNPFSIWWSQTASHFSVAPDVQD